MCTCKTGELSSGFGRSERAERAQAAGSSSAGLSPVSGYHTLPDELKRRVGFVRLELGAVGVAGHDGGHAGGAREQQQREAEGQVVDEHEVEGREAQRDVALVPQLFLVEAEVTEEVAGVDKGEGVEDDDHAVHRIEPHAACRQVHKQAGGDPSINIGLPRDCHVDRRKNRHRPAKLVDQSTTQGEVALRDASGIFQQRRKGLNDQERGWHGAKPVANDADRELRCSLTK